MVAGRTPRALYGGKATTALLGDATSGRESIGTDTETPRNIVERATPFGIGGPRYRPRIERGAGRIDIPQR